ncbi:MAG: PEGA domain-containing protein, partial [Myxococcales bacterium]|nr:PEGA domain-containing protein [Myxococcales bacterium]
GEAVKAFRAFLESNPPPQKAQMAHTLIAELEPTVSLSSQPAGAAVFIDDGPKPVGRTPLQIPLVAGAHRAVLKLPGHAPATKRLRVLPGKPLAVDVKLTPGYGGAPVQVDEPEPMVPMAVTHPVTPRGGASKGLAWTLVGLGAVAAGGAVAAQVFGREAASDRDAARTGAAWDDAHDQVGTWNLVFWASTGVAAAAVTTGVILLTTGDGPGPVQVGVGPGGASLSGRF